MIPKIIHYCWFGGSPFPREVKKCIASWKKNCPDYKIVFWNEDNFDYNDCMFAKEAYKHKAWAFVSDYARLKIINENGGIYLDTDVELLKNLDSLLNEKCFLASDQHGRRIATGLGFGAEKDNPIISEMLHIYYETIFDIDNCNEISCPVLNTKVMKRHGFEFSDRIVRYENVTVYPPKYFDPLGCGKSEDLLCDDTISIHHYTASWTPFRQRLKRKIANCIGYSNIQRIKKIVYKDK